MGSEFSKLQTTQFQSRMRPKAIAVYRQLFPGCKVEDLRQQGAKVHVLDQEFGIHCMIVLPSGQWLSVQEKYRQNTFLANDSLKVEPPVPDFTQEITNATGTQHESPGEWFKLASQLYFYGWASRDESQFEKWVLVDIVQYKLIVERNGGITRMGRLYRNRKHGAASFVAFPVTRLRDAWVRTYRNPSPVNYIPGIPQPSNN